uniref:Uncharacterized protein n=1 Tax=Rhizophora mucronata TaxID=61149 RepID=A0A2P2PXN1_RHIMU
MRIEIFGCLCSQKLMKCLITRTNGLETWGVCRDCCVLLRDMC